VGGFLYHHRVYERQAVSPTQLLPWQTQLADFTQTLRNGARPELPPAAVGLMLQLGMWSGPDALQWTRRARGDWPTGTLAAIAPYLPRASVEKLLRLPDALPRYTWLADRPDLRSLIDCIRVLTDEAQALQTLTNLPDNCRVLLAGFAVKLAQQLPDSTGLIRKIVDHALRHASLIDRVLESAEVLFELLPDADPATQQVIIEQTIERIYDEDFPVLASLWRLIAAVDPDRALAQAQRERLAYPRAARFAAVSWHLPPKLRGQALETWLQACQALVADGFSLRGNPIPTPLPENLLAGMGTLLQQTGPHDQAYVLSQLAPHHPACASPALLATAKCHPIHRALAWVVFGERLEGLRPRNCPARSYLDRGHRAVAKLQACADEHLFNEQRAWIGWHAETFSAAQWCTRAISQLPQPHIGPALATFLGVTVAPKNL